MSMGGYGPSGFVTWLDIELYARNKAGDMRRLGILSCPSVETAEPFKELEEVTLPPVTSFLVELGEPYEAMKGPWALWAPYSPGRVRKASVSIRLTNVYDVDFFPHLYWSNQLPPGFSFREDPFAE